jgi:Flp pilus assembly pilin Flp
MLCGLMLNGLVTEANAGTMPVVGMPSRLHPASPMWQAATSNTRLPFLADQARLGLFSVGDFVLLFGGILVVAVGVHRTLKFRRPAFNVGVAGMIEGFLRKRMLTRERLPMFTFHLWSEDDAQDIAEYAVMLAVILVIVVGTVRLIGSHANSVFSQVASAVR